MKLALLVLSFVFVACGGPVASQLSQINSAFKLSQSEKNQVYTMLGNLFLSSVSQSATVISTTPQIMTSQYEAFLKFQKARISVRKDMVGLGPGDASALVVELQKLDGHIEAFGDQDRVARNAVSELNVYVKRMDSSVNTQKIMKQLDEPKFILWQRQRAVVAAQLRSEKNAEMKKILGDELANLDSEYKLRFLRGWISQP